MPYTETSWIVRNHRYERVYKASARGQIKDAGGKESAVAIHDRDTNPRPCALNNKRAENSHRDDKNQCFLERSSIEPHYPFPSRCETKIAPAGVSSNRKWCARRAVKAARQRRSVERSEPEIAGPAPMASIRRPSPKWKRRRSVADLPTRPSDPSSTVFSIEEEAIVVAFRKHIPLPLDDCRLVARPHGS